MIKKLKHAKLQKNTLIQTKFLYTKIENIKIYLKEMTVYCRFCFYLVMNCSLTLLD